MGDRGYFMMIFELGKRIWRILKEFKLQQTAYDFLLGAGGGRGELGGGGRGIGGGDESTGTDLQLVSRLFTVVNPEAWRKISK